MIVSQFTTRGVRELNEDTIHPKSGEPAGGLFIIADGLGGHADGKMASDLACRRLRRIVEQENPRSFVLGGQRMDEQQLMGAFLSDAVRQAGATVWHEAKQRGSDMGTTLTVVLLEDGHGYCAHVGDCALFVAEGGDLPPVKMTTEHRRGANLTRTLGTQEQVTPDILSFTFDVNSAMVMGCDGFWEHVSPEQMTKLLLERPGFCVAEELGQAALAAGSQDNVSVLVVQGDGFVAQHAGDQMEAYAAALQYRDDIPQVTVQRRALLRFGAQHGASSQHASRFIAGLLRQMPDHAPEAWDSVRGSLSQGTQAEVARLAEGIILPLRDVRVRVLASADRHNGAVITTGGEQVADYPGAAQTAVEHAMNLIAEGDLRQGFSELDQAVVRNPQIRSTAEDSLKNYLKPHLPIGRDDLQLRKPPDESELALLRRYLAFMPGDQEARHALGLKLWAFGDQRGAWAELRQLYASSASWQESLLAFLQEERGSVDPAVLRDYVGAAMEVHGPGVVWALTELVRCDPSAPGFVRRCAGEVAAGWPEPQERQAAKCFLEELGVSPEPATTPAGREAEYLKRSEWLRRELVECQRELEETRRRERNCREHLRLSQEWARRLALGLMRVWTEHRRQCEHVLPYNQLHDIHTWLHDQGVTAPRPEKRSAQSKRRSGPRSVIDGILQRRGD